MAKYPIKEVVRIIKGRRVVFRIGDKVVVPWSREGKTPGKIDSMAMISGRSGGRPAAVASIRFPSGYVTAQFVRNLPAPLPRKTGR